MPYNESNVWTAVRILVTADGLGEAFEEFVNPPVGGGVGMSRKGFEDVEAFVDERKRRELNGLMPVFSDMLGAGDDGMLERRLDSALPEDDGGIDGDPLPGELPDGGLPGAGFRRGVVKDRKNDHSDSN